MNEEIDLNYINNYGIDEFNTELLLNPAEVANNKFLRLAEAEKPDLPMLCPLAKALITWEDLNFVSMLAKH